MKDRTEALYACVFRPCNRPYGWLLLTCSFLSCPIAFTGSHRVQQSFEVASVKVSPPGPTQPSITISPGGRLTATAVSIRRLIRWAYQVQDFQILKSQPPIKEMEAAFAQTYEIVAKAEGNVKPAEMRLLVQELLKDRFRLQMHDEAKEMDVYALVLDNGGPKLRPSNSAGEGSSHIAANMEDEAVELTFPSGATMLQLTNFLSAQRGIGKPVIDRTGLEGAFDFKLRWLPIDGISYVDTIYNAYTGPTPAPAPPLGQKPSGSPLPEALQRQLGLRLKPDRTAIRVFVIDHVQSPSSN
jgi:bla regulator protein blaR1